MASTTSQRRSPALRPLGGRFGRDAQARHLDRFIIALILLNGLAVLLESNAALRERHLAAFLAFEVFSVGVFTVEYFVRLWASVTLERYAGLAPWQARLRYLFSPMALIDLLAIAPFYLSLLIPIDLRYLRLFRLLRLLKLSSYFDGLHVFGTVLRREAGALAGALLTLMVLIVVSACLMFSVENAARPGHFDSIIDAIWWSVVTLTTVGYGDITPITFGGKLLAIVIMMLGVCTMALPAGILAARFSEELQNRRELLRSRVVEALRDGEIDASEDEAIQELAARLSVSCHMVRSMIDAQRTLQRSTATCPHCGEVLNLQRLHRQ